MIKSLTKSFKNLGSKFLIIIIALSFAAWGIGDIFVTNSSNPSIAKVGNSEIKLNEFQLDYQLLVDRLRQSNNQPITEEFLKAIGLHHNVVNSLVTKKYINFLADNLQINIGDKYTKKAIVNNPLFNDQLGVFNKDYFNYYLSRNNLKEKDIYKITQDAISNDLIMQSITHSEFVPKKMAESFLKKRDTVRKAKIFTFDTSSMIISDRNYSDDVIRNKYQSVKKDFLNPETRDIKIVTFYYNSEKNSINITNQELERFYNENINLFKTEETRDVYVAQFETKEEINEFESFFNKEKNFFYALEKFNKSKENSYLGKIKKEDLDPVSSKIVFKISDNQISKVLKTSFGFKVFFVEKINLNQTQSFSSVKEKIKKDILKEKTNEKVYNTANIFYEKFLETKNFAQSLENIQSEIQEFSDLGLNDIENTDKLQSIGLDENELSKIIFNLKSNDISEIIEDENNNLHYIYLNKINPAQEKQFKTVKNDIINLLYDEERDKVAKQLAEDFKKNYLLERSDEIYKNKFFNSKTSEWVTLDNRLGKEIPLVLKELIFFNKLNNLSDIVSLKTANYVIVLPIDQSEEILEEDQRSSISNITTEINNSLENDLNNAIINDLSKLYKSNINQKFLDSF